MSIEMSASGGRRSWKFLLGLAIALSVVVLGLKARSDPIVTPAPDTGSEHEVGVAGIGPVLAGGKEMSLAEARGATRLPMILPETNLARS